MQSHALKRIRVNTIRDSRVRRILKPCEARAGHGTIMTIIVYFLLFSLIFWAYKLVSWLIGNVSGWFK